MNSKLRPRWSAHILLLILSHNPSCATTTLLADNYEKRFRFTVNPSFTHSLAYIPQYASFALYIEETVSSFLIIHENRLRKSHSWILVLFHTWINLVLILFMDHPCWKLLCSLIQKRDKSFRRDTGMLKYFSGDAKVHKMYDTLSESSSFWWELHSFSHRIHHIRWRTI